MSTFLRDLRDKRAEVIASIQGLNTQLLEIDAAISAVERVSEGNSRPDASGQTVLTAEKKSGRHPTVTATVISFLRKNPANGLTTLDIMREFDMSARKVKPTTLRSILSRMGKEGRIYRNKDDGRWFYSSGENETPDVAASGASKTDKPYADDHLGLFLSTSTGQRPNGEGNSPESSQYEQNGRTADTGNGSG